MNSHSVHSLTESFNFADFRASVSEFFDTFEGISKHRIGNINYKTDVFNTRVVVEGRFTKEFCSIFRKKFTERLNQLCSQVGLNEIRLGNIRWTNEKMSFTLTAYTHGQGTNAGLSIDEILWNRRCAAYGLSPEDRKKVIPVGVGKRVEYFELVSINSKPKFKFDVFKDGRKFGLSLDVVKKGLDQLKKK